MTNNTTLQIRIRWKDHESDVVILKVFSTLKMNMTLKSLNSFMKILVYSLVEKFIYFNMAPLMNLISVITCYHLVRIMTEIKMSYLFSALKILSESPHHFHDPFNEFQFVELRNKTRVGDSQSVFHAKFNDFRLPIKFSSNLHNKFRCV